MARTPIPESTGEKLVSILKGPVLLVGWRLLLVLLILVIVLVLVASGGFFGLLLAGMLVSTLIRDDVRAAVSDLWHMRFWRVE